MSQGQSNKQNQQDAIVFSSDDSLNTDNSFNSSVQDDDADDYQNNFFHLKDQISQFFLAHPELNDAIQFEPINFEEQEQQMSKNTVKNEIEKPKYQNSTTQNNEEVQQKNDNKEKSRLWAAFSKDIVRNGQSKARVPTLETVNHRLNLFKSQIQKIDYIELLSKEMPQNDKNQKTQEQQQKDQNASEKQKDQPNADSDEDEDQQNKINLQEETQFYSFQKKMQQTQKQKMMEGQNSPQFQKRAGLLQRGKTALTQVALSLSPNRRPTFTPNSEKPKNEVPGDDRKNELPGDMQMQTQYGNKLYQMYLNAPDRQSFKVEAINELKQYNETKAQLYKNKTFNPQIPQFTSEQAKHLNLMLPDFTNPLQVQNQQNIFQGIDLYQLEDKSQQSDFMQIIDQIINGQVLSFWRECQNNS